MQDGPDYFDPPGGLLSLDLHVGDLLERASHLKIEPDKPIQLESFMPHFHLVNAQLSQVALSHRQWHSIPWVVLPLLEMLLASANVDGADRVPELCFSRCKARTPNNI